MPLNTNMTGALRIGEETQRLGEKLGGQEIKHRRRMSRRREDRTGEKTID